MCSTSGNVAVVLVSAVLVVGHSRESIASVCAHPCASGGSGGGRALSGLCLRTVILRAGFGGVTSICVHICPGSSVDMGAAGSTVFMCGHSAFTALVVVMQGCGMSSICACVHAGCSGGGGEVSRLCLCLQQWYSKVHVHMCTSWGGKVRSTCMCTLAKQ